ncbi:MAG TPA: hypothetical protein VIS99_03705 [Terrimicrobiaceae bacterium]
MRASEFQDRELRLLSTLLDHDNLHHLETQESKMKSTFRKKRTPRSEIAPQAFSRQLEALLKQIRAAESLPETTHSQPPYRKIIE